MKKLIAVFLCLCLTMGIAPVIAEQNAPAFTEKAVPVIRTDLESTETAVLRYYEDLPDIPYMNVVGFYNQFYLMGTELTEGMTYTRSGDIYTLKNIAGRTAQFDVGADTISSDNLERFATTAHTLQAEMAGIPDSSYPFVIIVNTFDPETTEPKTLNLGDYGIDLRGDEGGVYAPVVTLCDIFATFENFYLVFTGEKLYTRDYTKAFQSKSAMMDDPDFVKAVKADRTAEAADFDYRELCFSLDLWYGQPGQEWLHEDLLTMKLDEILTQKYPEIKKDLLSTDFTTYLNGLSHLLNGLLSDGGHTAVTSTLLTEYLGELLESLNGKEYAQNLNYLLFAKEEEKAMCKAARDAAYGDDYYIEQGDTAMIHFDSFVVDMEGWKAFYAGTGERPLKFLDDKGEETYDTVGVVLSGLERASQNPAIRNIVMDLSCNGGGDDFALYSIEWLLTGKGYVHFENEFSGQIKTKNAAFDMNFDGRFDEKDVSPYTDYNYAVLTSSISFSCGNAFPWFMHEHNAMILGQRSTGGACGVRTSSSRGIEFGCSASSSRIISDSGEIVDSGCPLDVNLLNDGENPYENFFDLTNLSNLMNEFFDAALDDAA